MLLTSATCLFLLFLLDLCHGYPRIQANNNGTEERISADINFPDPILKMGDPNSDLMIDFFIAALVDQIIEAGMDPMDLEDHKLNAIGFEASVRQIKIYFISNYKISIFLFM